MASVLMLGPRLENVNILRSNVAYVRQYASSGIIRPCARRFKAINQQDFSGDDSFPGIESVWVQQGEISVAKCRVEVAAPNTGMGKQGSYRGQADLR